MIRLFVGIDLPENVKKELQSLQKGLPSALWRPDKKMHLTLRFIGNLEEPVAEEVLKELRYIRFPAFHFALKGIGYFERGGIPHHIWAGVEGDKAIRELQQKIDLAVKKAGAGQADQCGTAETSAEARARGSKGRASAAEASGVAPAG